MKPLKCVERTCSIFSTRGKFCLSRIFGSYTLFLFRRNNDDVIMRSCNWLNASIMNSNP